MTDFVVLAKPLRHLVAAKRRGCARYATRHEAAIIEVKSPEKKKPVKAGEPGLCRVRDWGEIVGMLGGRLA